MIRAIIFSLLAWPAMVMADPVTIRSGEHETFSRLVLAIGEGTDWSLTKIDRGFRLELDGREGGFDTSEVFGRIPRDRLVDLATPADEVLDLIVRCDCHTNAFLWQPGQLVVDVIDGPDPDAPSVAELTPQNSILLRPTAQTALPDTLALPNGLTLSGYSPKPSVDPAPVDQEPLATNDTRLQLGVTETALLESVAQAASQGFLSPNVISTATDPQPQTNEPAAPPAAAIERALDRPGVGVSTALDDMARLGQLVGDAVEENCLPAAYFNVSDWADPTLSLHAQIAALAEDLAGDFGVETSDAKLELVKVYLFFGLGAEARVVLRSDERNSQERSFYYELAGAIDGYEEAYAMLRSQSGCEGAGSLWSFMLEPEKPSSDQHRNKILQDFFALSPALRSHLAPRLSAAFLQVGDDDAAEKALRPVADEHHLTAHEVQAVRAEVALEQDRAEEAVALLTEQVRDNARTSPEAMIRYLDLVLQRGESPAEGDLLLADAMRVEFGDAPIASDLARAEARGWAARLEFEPALDILKDQNDEAAAIDRNAIYTSIAEKASSGVFLELVFQELPSDLADETENAIARRLLDLGFAEQALATMTGTASRQAAADRRYLRAEASIAAGDYLAAVEALLGMNDDRAQLLRSQAYEGLGEYRDALSALDSDQDVSSATLQFRAQAWERLTLQDDPVLSQFATAFLDPAEPEVETLADRRAILERSQESRQAVQDLLLRFDGLAPSQTN